MTKEDREQFRAAVHIGVLTVADVGGRAPLSVPLGYLYEPDGEIRFATAKDSRKMTLVRAAGRVSFLVRREQSVPTARSGQGEPIQSWSASP